MLSEKKQFWLTFIVTNIFIFLFWTFAYFKTEAKPLNVPLYGKISFDNYWLLLPIIFLNYWLLYQKLKPEKFNKKLIFCLALTLILLLNSLKINFPFYSSLKHDNDYYNDSQKIKNLKQFLSSFDRHIYYYSLHTRTHPPGPVLFHFFLNRIFKNQLILNSLVMISLSSLTFLVVLNLANFFKVTNRNLIMLLFYSSPGILLYSATCMDMIFCLLISSSIYQLLILTKYINLKNIILTSVLIFFSSFFHYAAIIIPLFSLIYLILTGFKNKKFIISLILIGLIILGTYFTVYFISGFNLVKAYKASNFYNTMQNPDFFMTTKRYFYGVSSNLIEYIIFLGIPIFTLLLVNMINMIKRGDRQRLIYYFSFILPIVIFNFLGIFKSTGWTGETGRVWLFITPLILGGLTLKNKRLLSLVAFLSFLQTLIMQLTLNIFW